MSLTPVTANNTNLSKRCSMPNFGAGKVANQPAKLPSDTSTSADKFINKIEKMPPAAVGLSSAALWFGVGIGIDRVLGMIFKGMTTSPKSSLLMNGIFGAVMGTMAY